MKTYANSNLTPSVRQADVLRNFRLQQLPRAKGRARVLLLAAVLAAGTSGALAQFEAMPPEGTVNSPATNAPSAEAAATTTAPAEAAVGASAQSATNAVATTPEGASSTNGLIYMNYRNAPLDLVLNGLSKAAGFIIDLQTNPRGYVSVISDHPMTKDEVVNLLNSVLNRNGYAAIRNGRTLKIMDKNTAKSSDNPVHTWSDNNPDSIPDNDAMATWILPIRFVEASQLVSDLSPFVSPQATIIANQAGNSIVVTDVQSNIRHLCEIIKAIDSSAEDVTEVKVFHLQYADPTEMASLLTSLFPDQSSGAQAPFRFNRGRGGRGGPGAFFAAMASANAGAGNSVQDRIKKRNQVMAVADERTSSLVVTATSDLMDQITEMVAQLDHPSPKSQRVAVIPIHNGDSQAILQSLQDTFGNSNTRNRTTSTQNDPFQYRLQQSLQNNGNTIGTGMGAGIGTGRSGGRSGASF